MSKRWPSFFLCLFGAWLMQEAAPLKADSKPLEGAVIVVDPGHGGQSYSKSYTGGTKGVVTGMTESELNLKCALELEKILKENGATVYIARVADHRLSPEAWGEPGQGHTPELQARIDYFEHYAPHFFLSVHHNAGGAGGHTTLYKKDSPSDSLYAKLAKDVNDALEGVVPGPKNALIGNVGYFILGHTDIPGTIAESGFMTNASFDRLSITPEYQKKEAGAICKGAIKFWQDNKQEIIALNDKMKKDLAAHPRDPNKLAAIDLNPAYQAKMKEFLSKVAPGEKYDPAKIGEYLENFKKIVVTDPNATFTVKGQYDGKLIKLSGATSNKKYHDQLINMLVAMKLYNISNEIVDPKDPPRQARGKGKGKAKAAPVK